MLYTKIYTIPHENHRYPTLGDYYTEFNGWDEWESEPINRIFVSDMEKPDYEFLIGIHELVEMYLCKKRGIKEEDITAFDKKFEDEGKEGEPGDEKNAPYYKEHQFATVIERMVCNELGLDWKDYELYTEDFFNNNK